MPLDSQSQLLRALVLDPGGLVRRILFQAILFQPHGPVESQHPTCHRQSYVDGGFPNWITSYSPVFFSQQGIMKPFKDAEMEAAEKCQTGAYWYLMPGTMNDSTGGTF